MKYKLKVKLTYNQKSNELSYALQIVSIILYKKIEQ